MMTSSILSCLVLLALHCVCVLTAAVVPRKTVPVVAVGFNDDTIAKVEANMLQISTHRWVLGVVLQTKACVIG